MSAGEKAYAHRNGPSQDELERLDVSDFVAASVPYEDTLECTCHSGASPRTDRCCPTHGLGDRERV